MGRVVLTILGMVSWRVGRDEALLFCYFVLESVYSIRNNPFFVFYKRTVTLNHSTIGLQEIHLTYPGVFLPGDLIWNQGAPPPHCHLLSVVHMMLQVRHSEASLSFLVTEYLNKHKWLGLASSLLGSPCRPSLWSPQGIHWSPPAQPGQTVLVQAHVWIF